MAAAIILTNGRSYFPAPKQKKKKKEEIKEEEEEEEEQPGPRAGIKSATMKLRSLPELSLRRHLPFLWFHRTAFDFIAFHFISKAFIILNVL